MKFLKWSLIFALSSASYSHLLAADVHSLFKELPKELLPAEKEGLKSAELKVKDLRNGYIEIDTSTFKEDPFESSIQVALFKTKTKDSLLAVAYEMGDSTDDLNFYKKVDGKWTDVKELVFPQICRDLVAQRGWMIDPRLKKDRINLEDCASGTYKFILPRKGTNIKALTAADCAVRGKLLFEYDFDGERFSMLPF